MLSLKLNKSELQHIDWKNLFLNSSNVEVLQQKIDLAEKMRQKPFHDFSDIEMVQWFLHRKKHLNEEYDRSERTIKEYSRELSLFIEQLLQYAEEIGLDIDYIIEGSLFKSLQSRHIRRYQEWLAKRSPYVLEKRSYSAATLARKTTILKSFLKFLYDVKYVNEPLHEGLRIATVRKDDRPNRDLGPKEVMKLLQYFKEKNHPIVFGIIHVLTTTGLRNEEFCKLKVKDLIYDSILDQYYLDVQGKGNKRRQVPVREKPFNSIIQFRKARELPDIHESDPDSPLFTTNTGKAYTPSYLSQYLTKAIENTNLPFLETRSTKITPHVFRHSFAIISYLSGADIYDIMRSLGHEKIETTMIYLEKIFERERHVIHEWDSEVFGEFI